MTNIAPKRIIAAALLALLALISFFGIAQRLSRPETYSESIAYLDEKRNTVVELTAASAAASTAITLLPGDAATPIAEKLADLSSYFLVVICAIFLEKYLITILGYLAFRFLIPAACLLALAALFRESAWLRTAAARLTLFALAISLVIPCGVKVSCMIEDTYQTSIDETIAAAKDASQEAEEHSASASDSTENQGFLSGIASSIKDTVSQITDRFETVLSSFIEALAVLIITSCVIPVLVLLTLLWIAKTLAGVDLPLPVRKKPL